MAKTDIANLVVKISGSAEALDKEISGAERRLQGFTSKLASPLNAIRGIGGGITDMIGKPMGALITDVTRFTGLIPGLGALSGALAHPIEAAEKAMHRLDKLAEDASRIGLDPQYLRGFQIAAEAEAGAIGSVMARLLKFQSQLRTGSEDLTQPGGSAAGKIAKELQLNIAEWKAANPEQLFQLFAKGVQEAARAGTEFDFATRIASKGAAGLMNTLMNSGAVDEYTRKVREAGVATRANVGIATAWDDMMKDVQIRSEAMQERMVASGGMFSIAMAKLSEGSPLQAGEYAAQGVANYLKATTPFLGWEPTIPAQQTTDLINNTQKILRDANDKGANNVEINKLNDELNKIIEIPGSTIGLRLFAHISEMGEKAKNLIPKTPSQNLELAAESAAVLKKRLEDAIEPGKILAGIFESDRMQKLSQGRSLTEALLTPAEKLRKELEESENLDLTDESRRRLLERTRKTLMGAQPTVGPGEANVALFGSQEWAKRFSASAGQADAKDDDALKEAKRAADLLDEINRKLGRDEKPVPLMAPPGP